jgi:hypothetical protein
MSFVQNMIWPESERCSCILGERSRLGCSSVRLAPNICGVAITKRRVSFERLCEPRGAAHCARGGRAPLSNCIVPAKSRERIVVCAVS